MQIPIDVIEDLYSRFIINQPKEEFESFDRIFYQTLVLRRFYSDECTGCSITPFESGKVDLISCLWLFLILRFLKCLLVQGYGAKSWGFPKGKVNLSETGLACAIREVIEEIGFDIGPYIHDPQRDRISRRATRDAQFAPQTRKEIGRIQWWPVDSLPHPSQRVSKFFQVAAFVPWCQGIKQR
ncbi:putative mRNA-decapping enzyme 2 [Paratrimastix pyriformis]|uniref:mRNA-decapping enzyme 2 n=1 Tax=Paratrimastix pyriformis TaxID=342808 RepID=A0ABQ8UY90_9EUKA|nr:putative mRNA-decapping enzyme 2 [Paratrimastix pyriformis]